MQIKHKFFLKKLLLFLMVFLFVVYTIQPQLYYSMIKRSSENIEIKAATNIAPYVPKTPYQFNFYAYNEPDNVLTQRYPLRGGQFILHQYYKPTWQFDFLERASSSAGINGIGTFYNIGVNPSGYNFYYIEVVKAPNGFKKYPYNLVSNPTGTDSFVGKYGDYWGPYWFDNKTGRIGIAYDGINRPITQHDDNLKIVEYESVAPLSFDPIYVNKVFIKKDSNTSLPIQGVKFSITKADNGVPYKNPGVIETNQNGELILLYLTVGQYTLSEIRLDGYQKSKDIKFEVLSNDNQDSGYISNVKYEDGSLLPEDKIILNEPSTLRIQKVDELGKALDADLILTRLNDNTIIPNVKKSIGLYHFERLPKGEYELVEPKAPFGYKIPPAKWTVQVSNEGLISVEDSPEYISQTKDSSGNTIYNIKNYPVTADLHFFKLENPSGKTLDGFSFQLKNLSDPNATVITSTSGQGVGANQGEVLFNKLKPGKYELSESVRKPGYIWKDNKIIFDVELNTLGTIAEIKNIVGSDFSYNTQNGRYEYINYREQYAFYIKDPNGKPLADAKFTVTSDSDPNLVFLKVSDKDGKVTLNRTATHIGTTFTITQTDATLGFQKVDEKDSWKINVDPNGVVSMIAPIYDTSDPHKQYKFYGSSVVDPTSDPFTVTNVPLYYDFSFIKLGRNLEPLPGAEFTITKMVKNTTGSYEAEIPNFARVTTSLQSGMVNFESLPIGIYKIEETKTPYSYIDNSGLFDLFEISLDSKTNTLKLSFLSETRNLVQGAVPGSFKVVNSPTSLFKFTLYGFTGNDTGSIIDVISPSAKVAPLSGAEFKLTQVSDPSITFSAVSDGKGLVAFDGPTDNIEYIFEQVSTPTTHIKSNTVYKVIFENIGGVITPKVTKQDSSSSDFIFNRGSGAIDYLAVNEKNDVVIKVKKVGDTGANLPIYNMPGLQGAIYQLYEYDMGTEVIIGEPIEVTSSSDGMMEFKNFALPGKSYILIEALAPPNYFTDSPKNLFGVVQVGSDKSVKLVQTMPEIGDNPSPTTQYWYFDNATSTIYVKNIERFPKLTLLVGDDKTNANGNFGNLLQGAKFTLTMLVKNEAGDLVPTTDPKHIFNSESNDKGIVDILPTNYIPPHTLGGDPYDPAYVYYRLEETSAPLGHKTISSPLTIRIDRQNEVEISPDDLTKLNDEVLFDLNTGYYALINNPIMANITFFKVDGNLLQRKLSLSKFRLYSEAKYSDTEKIGEPLYDRYSEQISEEALNFDELTIGTYYLEEVKSPSGYQLMLNPIKIEVKERLGPNGERTSTAEVILQSTDTQYIERVDLNGDGLANDLVVKNYTRPFLPRTGNFELLYLLLFGLMMIFIGSYGYLYYANKYSKEGGSS